VVGTKTAARVLEKRSRATGSEPGRELQKKRTQGPARKEASLIISAAQPGQFPPERQGEAIEIAFLGRSNVGKSSLLNRLIGQPGLAFTSARPGCTQLINFFKIDEGVRFVDLPGYGYAQVSLEERARWKKLIESYLFGRQSLALSLLLIDARRGWMDMDLELKAWLEFHNRRYQVIITKIDKLKGSNQLKAGLAEVGKELNDQQPVPFSAVDGRGVREIWQIISKIKNKQ
jgi:GTP-binding protein